MIIIFSLISMFIEEIIKLSISDNSLFLPLFTLLSLLLIYPHLENKQSIFFYSVILGAIYDISYTQTLFMNTLLFLIVSSIIYLFYRYIPYHLLSTIILSVLLIILYRFLTYLLFILFNDVNFNIYNLFRSIYTSLILNIIYIIVSYFLVKIIKNNKTKLNKYNYQNRKKSTFVRKNY